MGQNFVRQNGFLKISTIAVTANFMRRNAARMICAQYIGPVSSRVVCTYVYYRLLTLVDSGLHVCGNRLVCCCRDPSLLLLLQIILS